MKPGKIPHICLFTKNKYGREMGGWGDGSMGTCCKSKSDTQDPWG